MPGSTDRCRSIQDGGTGYDVSAMFNVPLIADRLALRLVGFTAEDAGFIDNVLSESPRGQTFPGEGTFDNADRVDEDVNSAQTKRRARGAALGRHRRC